MTDNCLLNALMHLGLSGTLISSNRCQGSAKAAFGAVILPDKLRQVHEVKAHTAAARYPANSFSHQTPPPVVSTRQRWAMTQLERSVQSDRIQFSPHPIPELNQHILGGFLQLI